MCYFIYFSHSFLLAYEIFKSLIVGFHYLDCNEKLYEEYQETKHLVKEIHQAIKSPEKGQDEPIPRGDISGGFYFALQHTFPRYRSPIFQTINLACILLQNLSELQKPYSCFVHLLKTYSNLEAVGVLF